jgi:hypothetical protein
MVRRASDAVSEAAAGALQASLRWFWLSLAALLDDVREIASGWLRIATDRGGQTVIRMRAAPRQRRLEGANDPDRLTPPRRPRSRLTAKVFRRR